MLKSGDESVRAAALKALGALGQAADVPVMARSLVASGAEEKAAARASFAQLKGQDVNPAILAELKQAKPEIRAELLGVLAARNAAESVPAVLEAAKDADAGVRLAALEALRILADPSQTAALVALLKAAKDAPEQARRRTGPGGRGRQGQGSLRRADPRRNGRGGPRGRPRPSCGRRPRRAASRSWRPSSPPPRTPGRRSRRRPCGCWRIGRTPPRCRTCLVIAKQAEPAAQQAVAVQGLIRQASPRPDHPADLAVLSECMKLARRPEEKRMVLGVLGGVPTPGSLSLVLSAMDDPALTDEACLAAILIAEDPKALDATQRQTTLQVIMSKTKDADLRKRAEQDLAGPPPALKS